MCNGDGKPRKKHKVPDPSVKTIIQEDVGPEKFKLPKDKPAPDEGSGRSGDRSADDSSAGESGAEDR